MVTGRHGDGSRVRPAIRRLGWGLGPLLVLIAAWQVWDAIEAGRLDVEVRRVLPDAEGSPGQASNPGRRGLEDDAARYYAAAAIAAIPTIADRTAIRPSPYDALVQQREALMRGLRVPPPVDAIAARALEQHEVSFRLIEEGSGRPFSRFAPGTEFNYRFSGLMTVARLAGLHTVALIVAGDADGAVRSLHARLRLLRVYDSDPRLFGAIAKAAEMRAIATDVALLVLRPRRDVSLFDTLDDALDQVYPDDELRRAIDGEARFMLNGLQSVWDRRSPRNQNPRGFLVRPVLRHHAVLWLRTIADAQAASRPTWPHRVEAMKNLEGRRSRLPEFGLGGYVAASRVLPQLQTLTESVAEGVASVRIVKMVLALERHRREHGRLPDRLEDVALRAADADARLDPFTGTPLRYVPEAGGYVIYSVGRDGSDGGGTFIAELPRGRAPGSLPPPDVGVSVIETR